MTETVVAYHVEDGDGRPAINVKDHNGGIAYTIALQRAVGPAMTAELRDRDEREDGPFAIAYERLQSDFWQNAEEIATQRGLGEIAQQGRSGGWLVFTDGRDPQDGGTFDLDVTEPCAEHVIQTDNDCPDCKDATIRRWLADYRAMVEWADAQIADAPRRVASLAQQYAMDEAGEGAARRMFATFRTEAARV